MRTLHCQAVIVLGVLIAATSGCRHADDAVGSEPASPVAAPAAPPVRVPAERAAGAGQGTDASRVTPATSPAVAKPSPRVERPTEPPFEPPYVYRADRLFSPPQQKRTVRTRPSDNTSEAIVLKGFVDVDGPRAVLRIGPHVVPLAVGQEKYGVRVTAINPPQVTLQQGRTRQTLSLKQTASGGR